MSPKAPTLFGGVDVGSSRTKVVLLDAQRQVLAQVARPSGVDYEATAQAGLREALERAGMAPQPDHLALVATGYGRHRVSQAQGRSTEIHCHGAGCYHHFARAITVVDIGGQDNKVIYLDSHGARRDFRLNRKCAAGTGSFLEEIALRLDLPLSELEPLARRTDQSVPLSSFCTVFAKTEILTHLRRGASVEQLVRGAFESVVQRVLEMDPLEGEVVLTGGVPAHNPTIVPLFSQRLGRPVHLAPGAQFTGALGAALRAWQSAGPVAPSPNPCPKDGADA